MSDLSRMSNEELMAIAGVAKKQDYLVLADRIAQEEGLPPESNFSRMITQESSGDPTAVSSKGAYGLAQLQPAAAQEVGVDRSNPVDNLRGGARYLKKQYERFGDWNLAHAAYNAGPENVTKYGGVPPFAETEKHVQKIMGSQKNLQDMSNEELMQIAGISKPETATTQPTTKPSGKLEWSDVPLKALENVPESATNLFKGMWQAIRHPADTVKNLGLAIVGGVELIVPGEQGNEDYARGIGKFFVNRYGGIEQLKKTMAEDPVGFLADVSTVLTGMSSSMARIPTLSKAASIVGKAGELSNPVTAAIKGTSLGLKGVKKLAGETFGMTTGGGLGFIEEAAKGTKGFDRAMRGEITGEEVVEHAKGAVQAIVDKRGEAYRQQLAQVQSNPQKLNQVKAGADRVLENLQKRGRFNIEPYYDDAGKLTFDFSKSPLVEQQALVKGAMEAVANWTDTTALGLDDLKKILGTYSRQAKHGSPAKAAITQLEVAIKDGLNKAVPGYAEMTRGYARATNLIKDIESNLMLRPEGMTGRITADQTLRRLSSALRENFEMRRDLLEVLGKEGGANIAGEVAGTVAQQALPRGLIAKLGGGGIVATAAASLNPWALTLLAAASPRIVGEFLSAYGKAAKYTVKPAGQAIGAMAKQLVRPELNIPMFQVGRLVEPRQFGGPVYPETPYLVGENGPEIVIPSTPGQVVPNSGLTPSGGGIYPLAPQFIRGMGWEQPVRSFLDDPMANVKPEWKQTYPAMSKVLETIVPPLAQIAKGALLDPLNENAVGTAPVGMGQIRPAYVEKLKGVVSKPVQAALKMQEKIDKAVFGGRSELAQNPKKGFFEHNVEYGASVDPDLLCQRSAAGDLAIRKVKDALGPRYNVDIAKEMIAEAQLQNIQTRCPQCYVYWGRTKSGSAMQKKVIVGEGGYAGELSRMMYDTSGDVPLLRFRSQGHEVASEALRNYSSTDFKPTHLPGQIVQKVEAAKRGIPEGAYTKTVPYAEIFGPTGEYINMSVGRDAKVGMNWDDAMRMREKYPNVGTTYVGFTIPEVDEILNHVQVDHVIPAHLGTAKAIDLQRELKDPLIQNFAAWQNELKVSPTQRALDKAPSKLAIKDYMHGGDLMTYLSLARERNVIPKFPLFLSKELRPDIMGIIDHMKQNKITDTKLLYDFIFNHIDQVNPNYMKLIGPEYGKHPLVGGHYPYRPSDMSKLDINNANKTLGDYLKDPLSFTPGREEFMKIADKIIAKYKR